MGVIKHPSLVEVRAKFNSVFSTLNVKPLHYYEEVKPNKVRIHFSIEWTEAFSLNNKNMDRVFDALADSMPTGHLDCELLKNQYVFNIHIDNPSPTPEIDGIINAGCYFNWSWENCGFGQFSMHFDGVKLTAMNECMSRESVRKLLHAFADYVADRVYLDDDEEPPKQIEVHSE